MGKVKHGGSSSTRTVERVNATEQLLVFSSINSKDPLSSRADGQLKPYRKV